MNSKSRIAVAEEVLQFWFSPRVRPLWFQSTPEFDDELRALFLRTLEKASSGGFDNWRDSARGALALVIVLDQFPLNMYRQRLESFATEAKAREVARQAIAQGYDRDFTPEERLFLYLPFMHSESLSDQEESVRLFEQSGNPQAAKFALHHHDIIRRFGRFPHRNEILGRASTEEEIAYLNSADAFHG